VRRAPVQNEQATRVQAWAVHALQVDGTLVREYWRGDRVTSRARLARVQRVVQ
jgi:hypothetical protein